jgi:hypothetical protein
MHLNDIRIACGFGMDGLSLETAFFQAVSSSF